MQPGQWIEVREPGTGWLLFRYDPVRRLVQIKRPGSDRKHIIDLSQYERDEEAMTQRMPKSINA